MPFANGRGTLIRMVIWTDRSNVLCSGFRHCKRTIVQIKHRNSFRPNVAVRCGPVRGGVILRSRPTSRFRHCAVASAGRGGVCRPSADGRARGPPNRSHWVNVWCCVRRRCNQNGVVIKIQFTDDPLHRRPRRLDVTGVS